MKIFQCDDCQSPVFFENTTCLNCGHALGYQSDYIDLVSLVAKNEHWSLLPDDGKYYKYCTNFGYGVCNWLVPIGHTTEYCEACALNRTIPNLDSADNLLAWHQLEKAKRRLIYSLKQLGLAIITKSDDPDWGLAFDFLSPPNGQNTNKLVQTGHSNGLITINLAEADSVHREWIRKKMSEPYRTLIGHFRHEIGHYYWEHLVGRIDENRTAFRNVFGDEQKDYSQALDTYYDQGAPVNWQANYISKYATSHPWEDWAETWAHYLHIMDTVETAYAFGLKITPKVGVNKLLGNQTAFNPYITTDFEKIIDAFIPITFATNSFNRGMGIADVYPFIIATTVRKKLAFIHELIFPVSLNYS